MSDDDAHPMIDTDAPAALWKAMTETQRQAAADAFWHDRDSVAEQTEVMPLLARKLNFRFKSVETMALERKTTHLMALGNVSDGVAGAAARDLSPARQRPMMGAFLDGLGIPHENGLIAEDGRRSPTPEARGGGHGDRARRTPPRTSTSTSRRW